MGVGRNSRRSTATNLTYSFRLSHVFYIEIHASYTVMFFQVSNSKESILKDESANRTHTVLHAFLALAQTKPSSILNVILQVMHLQKLKSLDNRIVLKVLNLIINSVGIKDLKTYLSNNILSLIHFWFTKNNQVADLPLHILGFDTIDSFIAKHMNWLIAGEILWLQEGNVRKSDLLKQVAKKHKKSIENILEVC